MQDGIGPPRRQGAVNVKWSIRELGPHDVAVLRDMLAMFGTVFDEVDTYVGNPPDTGYLRDLLAGESFIALAALQGNEVVGGIAAYELKKFEQERSEIYLYDLAVAEARRREGMATALIRALQRVAAERRAHVIFVQADQGDDPAIALYTGLGIREDVLHFDIPVDDG